MQRVLLDNLLEDFMGVNFGLHLPTIQSTEVSTSVLFTNKDKIWSSDWDHNQYTIF